MTTEQKEAIDRLNYINRAYDYNNYYSTYDLDCIDIVLNLIQEQEKEIDCLKNHVHYKICKNCGEEFRAKRNDARYCKKCAIITNNKEWYKNLTEEQKDKRREQSKISMRKIRERRKND